MITREELIKSKEFWLVRLQSALYEQVEKYLKDNGITKTEFAAKLGVSKGYNSQILNGDYDHKLSKFIELSLAINKAPLLELVNLEDCLEFKDIECYGAAPLSSTTRPSPLRRAKVLKPMPTPPMGPT